VYLGLSEDHARSASAFDKAGMGVSLGVADDVSDRTIAGTVQALIGDFARRGAMRRVGLMTVDGNGAARIAADLAAALAERRAGFKAAM
jgi:spore coat polysaccharide biosynthesis protein SpsF